MTSNRLWDVAAVAAYLDVPVSSVYKMTSRRASVQLPHVKLGGRLRFRPADIEAWLEVWLVSGVERLQKAAARGRAR